MQTNLSCVLLMPWMVASIAVMTARLHKLRLRRCTLTPTLPSMDAFSSFSAQGYESTNNQPDMNACTEVGTALKVHMNEWNGME